MPLIKQIIDLRSKCHGYCESFKQQISDKKELEAAIGCFGMLFNKTTLTLELLSHYYECWKTPRNLPQDELTIIQKENAERCMEAQKDMFIGYISAIEYSLKQILVANRLHPLRQQCEAIIKKRSNHKIYLGDIINLSTDSGIIRDKLQWECIIDVRNCSVHNNSIAETNKTYLLGNRRIEMTKDTMMKGTLDFFGFLSGLALNEYAAWLSGFINSLT